MLIKWWLLLESNQRHQDFQSCALPTELRSHKLVARPRFELGKCHSQSVVPYRLATGQ